MVDEDKAIFTDFDLAITYGVEAASHAIYRPDGVWIGHVFRDFLDEDWQIAVTGELNVRGAWPDFWVACSELLKWRKQVDVAKLKEMILWKQGGKILIPKEEKKGKSTIKKKSVQV